MIEEAAATPADATASTGAPIRGRSGSEDDLVARAGGAIAFLHRVAGDISFATYVGLCRKRGIPVSTSVDAAVGPQMAAAGGSGHTMLLDRAA